jgi:hypothetical protein
MAIKWTNIQGPPKFTQIGIFGFKIYNWQPCIALEIESL